MAELAVEEGGRRPNGPSIPSPSSSGRKHFTSRRLSRLAFAHYFTDGPIIVIGPKSDQKDETLADPVLAGFLDVPAAIRTNGSAPIPIFLVSSLPKIRGNSPTIVNTTRTQSPR